MTTQTQTKHAQIIDKINKIIVEGEMDQLTLPRLRRDADSMKDSSPGEYWEARGMLASLDRDVEEMRLGFKNAQDLRPSASNQILYHFAISLHNLGFLSEARGVLESISETFRGDKDFLGHLIDYSYLSGQFRDALREISNLEKLGGEEPEEFKAFLQKVIEFMEINEVPEREVQILEKEVEGFLRSQGINACDFDFDISTDEESSILVGSVLISKTIHETVALQADLISWIYPLHLTDRLIDHVHFHLMSWEVVEEGYGFRRIIQNI